MDGTNKYFVHFNSLYFFVEYWHPFLMQYFKMLKKSQPQTLRAFLLKYVASINQKFWNTVPITSCSLLLAKTAILYYTTTTKKMRAMPPKGLGRGSKNECTVLMHYTSELNAKWDPSKCFTPSNESQVPPMNGIEIFKTQEKILRICRFRLDKTEIICSYKD